MVDQHCYFTLILPILYTHLAKLIQDVSTFDYYNPSSKLHIRSSKKLSQHLTSLILLKRRLLLAFQLSSFMLESFQHMDQLVPVVIIESRLMAHFQ